MSCPWFCDTTLHTTCDEYLEIDHDAIPQSFPFFLASFLRYVVTSQSLVDGSSGTDQKLEFYGNFTQSPISCFVFSMVFPLLTQLLVKEKFLYPIKEAKPYSTGLVIMGVLFVTALEINITKEVIIFTTFRNTLSGYVPNSCGIAPALLEEIGVILGGGRTQCVHSPVCVWSCGRWQLREEFSLDELWALCIPGIIFISFHLADWQKGHCMGQREIQTCAFGVSIWSTSIVFQADIFLSTSRAVFCLVMLSILLNNPSTKPQRTEKPWHYSYLPNHGDKGFLPHCYMIVCAP